MFDGIDENRVAAMSDKEKRWLDNIKKAFNHSDIAMKSGTPEDRCLEEIFKAIDTSKTLRKSLRGDNLSYHQNKQKFIDFLGLEIPMARPDGSEFELRDTETGNLKKYTFGEIIYAIRCMIHENENLNLAEDVDYHILLDWSVRNPYILGDVVDGKFVCNGYFIWNRLREVLAKFIGGIEMMNAIAGNADSFSITIRPDLQSIQPDRKPRPDDKSPYAT